MTRQVRALGAVAMVLLLLMAVARGDETPQPEYRTAPHVSSVSLDSIPGVVRLDVPGRPSVAGLLPDEMVQVAPGGGRILITSGGGGRLHRPLWKRSAGRSGQLWSGSVEGPCALSPDGTRMALVGGHAVDVVKFLDARRVRLLRRIPTPGPVRALFSRDGRRLLLVDGDLRLEIWDLEKRVPPERMKLAIDPGMLEYLYLFPDNRTLLLNVKRESNAGRLYCVDLRTRRSALASAYNALDWTSLYRVSWDGRWVWTGHDLHGPGGSVVISDVEHFGLRREGESSLTMRAAMTWSSGRWRPGIASVGSAVAYAIDDRIEVLDLAANTVLRIEGWPVRHHEEPPAPVGFLEPQRLLAVQLGPSVYLLPVRYGR